MMQSVKIKTLEDMVENVPLKDLDNFLADLKDYLTIRIISKPVEKMFKEKFGHETIKHEFNWNNDGIVGCTGVKMEIKNEP